MLLVSSTSVLTLLVQITVGEDLAISVAYVGLETAPPCPPARIAAVLEAGHSIPLAWAVLLRAASSAAPAPAAALPPTAAAAATAAAVSHPASTRARDQAKRKRSTD